LKLSEHELKEHGWFSALAVNFEALNSLRCLSFPKNICRTLPRLNLKDAVSSFRAHRGLGRGCVANQRRQMLLKIHAPFAKLDKNSSEYKELARSGRVWEDYHKPTDSEKNGHMRVQKVRYCLLNLLFGKRVINSKFQECQPTLEEIDNVKKSMKLPVQFIAKQLVAEYAHQSVQIENNKLSLGESHKACSHIMSRFRRVCNASSNGAMQRMKKRSSIHLFLRVKPLHTSYTFTPFRMVTAESLGCSCMTIWFDKATYRWLCKTWSARTT
jgi:hypothetical protein